ncbi:MAG: DUF4382 domain-containing protein [Candidatus Methylomirabilales bacterium]
MGSGRERLGRWAGRVAAPLLVLAAATTAALLAAAASGQEGGRLQVWITDHREAIGDFASLPVTIAAVAIHPAGQPRREGWLRLLVPAPVVDLVEATREPVLLLEAPVPPGPYDAARLEMDRGRGTLKIGEEVAVTVPSRGTAAVAIRIRAGRMTVLTLDLVVHDLTDHPGKRYGVTLRRATVRH